MSGMREYIMSKTINVTQELKTFDGRPIMEKAEDGVKPMTLKNVLINALLVTSEKEHTNGETKMARFMLAQAIFKSTDNVQLASSEINMIKKLVNDCYTTMIVGLVYTILDAE